jgi:hypothetical protein
MLPVTQATAADPAGAAGDPAATEGGAEAAPPVEGLRVGVAPELQAATTNRLAMATTAPKRRERWIKGSSSPSARTDGVWARNNT